MVETLDAEIAALEAEQRRADAAARQRQEADARREAEQRRAEAKRDEERKARRTALVGVSGGVELFLANLADLDPKWNVDGNDATTGANIDAALDAAESDDTRPGRLGGVLSDEAADARFRQALGRGGRRFGTADLDAAVATAEALRRRVSRVRALFAAPGGDAALVAALEDRNGRGRTRGLRSTLSGHRCRRAECGRSRIARAFLPSRPSGPSRQRHQAW